MTSSEFGAENVVKYFVRLTKACGSGGKKLRGVFETLPDVAQMLLRHPYNLSDDKYLFFS